MKISSARKSKISLMDNQEFSFLENRSINGKILFFFILWTYVAKFCLKFKKIEILSRFPSLIPIIFSLNCIVN
jgi:hypothetical protein